MNKVLERIIKFIDYKGISYHAFDISIGASNGYIGKQIKNNGSIGSNVIEKIHQVYSELNLNWLFTGTGKMVNEYNPADGNIKNVSEPDNIGYKNNLAGSDEISKLKHLLNEANKDKETYRMLLEEAKLDKEIYRKIAEQNLGLKF